VGRASQAEVVRPEGHFHIVEHPLRHIAIFDKMLGRFFDGQVDRGVVVGGGDNQVSIGDNAPLIGKIVMDQGATWGLDDANPLSGAGCRLVPGVLAGDLRVSR